jgi:hypothetical protein
VPFLGPSFFSKNISWNIDLERVGFRIAFGDLGSEFGDPCFHRDFEINLGANAQGNVRIGLERGIQPEHSVFLGINSNGENALLAGESDFAARLERDGSGSSLS